LNTSRGRLQFIAGMRVGKMVHRMMSIGRNVRYEVSERDTALGC